MSTDVRLSISIELKDVDKKMCMKISKYVLQETGLNLSIYKDQYLSHDKEHKSVGFNWVDELTCLRLPNRFNDHVEVAKLTVYYLDNPPYDEYNLINEEDE
jgi:hypothetical protein